MGLGAWLAAETERKHYEVEEAREIREVKATPQKEEEEIYEIFEQYAIGRSAAKGVVDALKMNEDMWVKVKIGCATTSNTKCADHGLVHDGF